MQFIPQLPQSILFLFNLLKILYNTSILNKLQKQGENIMKLSFNKRAVAVALSLALATPIISTTAIPTINVFAGAFATAPAVAHGHAIPNTDAITISGNTVSVTLEGTGVSDAVKASTVVDIYPDSRSSSPAAVLTNLPLTWTGSTGAWTGFSFQLPANWQTRFHNSEQMGIKVTSTVGSTHTFSAMASKIVNNDTQISVEFPTVGATTLSAKVTGGSLYNNSVAQSLNDYTYEYTVAPQTSGSVTTAMANSIFNASANIVALSNASATADASGNFTLNLPAGKSIQNLGANDAIYVRRKAKHSNAQYIFIINSVRSAAQTPATPSNPRPATPSNPRPATSSNTVVNPTTPEKKETDVIIATNSNSRHRSSGGGSGSSGSRRSVNGSSYSSPATTTPAQNPAAPTANVNNQNTAGNVTRVPAPQGPSSNKQTKSRFSVPKTADASDIARNVIVLFGSVVGMAFATIGLKKKED
ncbi:hypothetical protein HMPREF1866_00035 [Lachnoanaerobaculum saburreum]|uniref:Uncharacterized protein n=2 Tax=Lachnoanaerobaculum saburreum TaxID=467210 RepID=A0A134A0P8_9FIRM|nr:hypothetical protein HMPREF1866_00035 [Lachnoanaerobaculum saburreum]